MAPIDDVETGIDFSFVVFASHVVKRAMPHPYPHPELPLTQIPTARSNSSQHVHRPPSVTSNHSRFSEFAQNGPTPPNEEGFSSPKPGGRRRRRDDLFNPGQDAKPAHLNRVGRLYEKVLTYGTGTRYSIYILPVAIIIMIPTIVGATQVSRTDPKIGGVRLVWFFTWIESVWLSFWGMRFVARCIPVIFRYFAGVVSAESKKYARVLENLRDMITVFGWVIISFVLYEILFETSAAGNTPYGWTKTFKQVLGAILVSTIIFMIEKIFVQLVSVNYHARSFNNRINDAKHAVYLLGLLFDASRSLFPMYGKEFFQEDYIIHANIETFIRKGHLGQGISINPKTSPNGHRRRIFKGIGRFNQKVNSVFGNIATELTGKSVLPPKSAQSIVTGCLEKTKSAKALAQRLWFSFVMEGNDCLHLSDIEEILGPQSQDIAEECFEILDPDENGDVTLDEITMKLTELSLERKAIARSMHDVSQAIKALDSVMSSVAFLLSLFALICFLDTGFHSILSTASTTLLSLSFIFSVTAQEFLGSCIFLFVKHPYDISDRVDIYGPDGINRLEVEQISLLYTSFKKVADLELVQIPNNILNTLWINNITRSKGLLERLDLYISFDTSMSDIEALRLEMEQFIRTAENSRDFQPNIVLRCVGVGSMDKLQLQLEVRHKSNWSNEQIRAARHSKLMCALVLALRKVPIFGPGGGAPPLGDPANPAYNVTVSDEMAAAAREKSTKDADAARLHPIYSNEPGTGSGRSKERQNTALNPIPETIAADSLNAIRLSEDALRDEKKDSDNIEIIGDSSLQQSSLGTLPGSSANLELRKSKTPQGRRKAGISATSRTSNARESIGGELNTVLSHVVAGGN